MVLTKPSRPLHILLASATEAEIAPFMKHASRHWNRREHLIETPAVIVQVLYTGVGMLAASYALSKKLSSHKYDFALQAGVAGSFDRSLALTQLVQVVSEQLGDTGAEDGDDFIDVFELGLAEQNHFPFKDSRLYAPHTTLQDHIQLPQVSGLTVASVTGSIKTAESRFRKFNCQIETMEGAAFHFVCLQEKLPFAQVRAISNNAEARDKSKWRMKEAVAELNNWLIAFFSKNL